MDDFEVIGLGQCSLDILGQVNHYPELDQKVELASLLIQGGGPVATAMVTLARLGVPVSFVGAVGDDDFGRQIRQGLLDEHVDCKYLVSKPGRSSQVAFISVDAEGHRNIFWHKGTASPELPDSLPALLNGTAKILHLDGLHLETSIAAATLARESKVLTALDAGTFRPGIERLLPLVDHLVVAERFALQACGGEDLNVALDHLAVYGARAVTITLGPQGSLTLAQGGERFLHGAFEVDAVDTTGCGDVFHGAYIYGLLQGWSLPEIVRFASACAALKTRTLGGRTAIPRLSEVEEFLRSVEL